jgi:dephospho-CoA kinase
MKILILTGTIGSGKSTVARILQELGAAVIDSDKIGRDVLNFDSPVFQDVINTFGQDILTSQNIIDRKKLAAKVFENPQALRQLNAIIHPRVDDAVEDLLEQYASQGKKAVFVEMAFIANPRWASRVVGTWVVKAPREIALKRLKQRGMEQNEALARLANQPDPETQVSEGLSIITNEGNLHSLREQVEKLWHKIDNE